MRIWNVDPKVLCRKHLFGEHVEMHMFIGTMNKKKSIDGYVAKGLIETNIILKRHNELADEMIRRGYTHNSPLVVSDEIMNLYRDMGKIDVENSLEELKSRCIDCKSMIKSTKNYLKN